MTSELETRLPDLASTGEGRSIFTADRADEAILTALMMRALGREANLLATNGLARLVSVSVDVTGTAFGGGEGEITIRTDRQTRTLLFMGGALASAGGLNLKATAIFRLDTA